MNSKQLRAERLMPLGIPRYVRCYDNGGETLDRYTACFTGRTATLRAPGCANEYPYRAMSAHPSDAQGFSQWGSVKHWPCDTMRAGTPARPGHTGWHRPPAMGRRCHLGRRIPFTALPKDCRKLVIRDYREIWGLSPGPG